MKTVVAAINAKFIHTALSLRLLKAAAQDAFPVEMAEYTVKDPILHIVTDLFARKPDVVGFSCYIWNIEETLQTVSLLRKVMPQVHIILGGPEVSFDPEHFMRRERSIDVIVMGEGETAFRTLLERFQRHDTLHDIDGIAWRNRSQPDVLNIQPASATKAELTCLPSPYRFEEDLPSLSQRIVYFETSRGCPFNCQFCLSSTEVGVRYFDMEQVKADLKYLIDHGARTIKFLDRTFNIYREYALDIFRFLIDHHNGCVFQFEITADIMRPEVLEFLNEHAPKGIFRFEIGVQSTNEETNRIVQRRQNWNKLRRTVELVKQGGCIDQHLDLIAGLPGEDYNSFRKTFNDVFELRPEELQLGFLKLLRGTGLRRDAEQHGYAYMEHAPYEMLSNDVLSFEDVIRIKQTEDILEKYWNAHRADETLGMCMSLLFETPWDFFQAFGRYWAEQGWSRIGHQLADLFIRLEQFLTEMNAPYLQVLYGMSRFDYMLQHRHKPRSTWWETVPKAEVNDVFKRVAENPQNIVPQWAPFRWSESFLHKHGMIHEVPFDLQRWQSAKALDDHITTTIVVLFGDAADMAARAGLPRWATIPS
ncbi:B12-binding domain-containing radical SAM protein [Paenibacillus selenitireducens]|uniref:B12-binding domain-containing radical SAM protein n=1 Tax=Paenibacillus selenitireducens TaxID=1324314 RepID=A0A1T2X1V0_9BACL|nr:B12-binding domain-containing radical SAM protein [Paenibacillus selenitireducens]OPA73543.1 B12-binding domain-containing radical SAM protein [Paenibacillus selenitireducens]